MAKSYWIKKNLNSNTENTEWIEMNGVQFYELVTSPLGKYRYFIDFDISNKIEVSKADYVKWRKEKDNCDYLKEHKKKYITISYYNNETQKGLSIAETIGEFNNGFEDVETKLIIEKLDKAVLSLTQSEQSIIKLIYYHNKSRTEIGIEIGISQQAVSKREAKILAKLKKILEK